jgi:hypothetical protein
MPDHFGVDIFVPRDSGNDLFVYEIIVAVGHVIFIVDLVLF